MRDSDALKNLKRRRKRELHTMVFSTFALIFVLIFVLYKMPNDAFTSSASNKQEKFSIFTEKLYEFNEETSYHLYPFTEEYMIQTSNDLLSFLSYTGDVEYTEAIQVQNINTKQNGDFFLLTDQGSHPFYLFNSDGLYYYGQTDSPIQKSAVSKSGKSAFLMEDIDSKGIVRVLDEFGKHILDWKIRDRLLSGYVISMEFTENSNFLDISLINTDGSEMKPIFYRLDLQEAKLSKLIELPEKQVYPVIYTLNNEDSVLVSSDKLVYIQNLQLKTWDGLIEIEQTFKGNEGIFMIGKQTISEPKALYYLQYSDLASESPISPSKITDLKNNDFVLSAGFGKFAISTTNGIFIVDEKNVNNLNFFSNEMPILKMKFINENVLVLISKTAVFLISL